MGVLAVVGYSALAMLVLGWLIVSFSEPGPRRAHVEWLSAVAMFLALACLFVSLFSRAQAADNLIAMIAFGFLCAVFGSGFLVAVFQLVQSFRGGSADEVNATN